jgi:L-alanine-DL-glutamate epimerase-like enolase superfamily enzyme
LSRRPARIYKGEQREGGQPSENGQFVLPDKPGLGLAFDQMAIKDYQIGSVARAGSGTG